ncbi:MAG: hypothetical protein ABJB98_10005 [Actinomycetota bacterium]
MSQPIQVDLTALHRLGRQLTALSQNLERTGGHSFIVRSGEPFVELALLDVQRDWCEKREAITGYLTSTGSAVEAAVSAYDQLESGIASTATPAGLR